MEWFEDDSFWSDFYIAIFPPERFAIADEQTEQILALTRFSGRSILDLCCGPGRHSINLAQRGFKVTGLDRSAFLLAQARERARTAGVEVQWLQEDMRRFHRPSSFDLICSLFTSFGYFDEESENLDVLRSAHQNLKPGGVFIIDVLGKEGLARKWLNSVCTKLEDGSLLLQIPEVRAGWTRVHNEWILIRDGRSRSITFEHTIYSGRELKDYLLAAGFTTVDLYGDLQGQPYGLDASRLVAVARKA